MRRTLIAAALVYAVYTYGPDLLQRVGFPTAQGYAGFDLSTAALSLLVAFVLARIL